ncbi:hypothetical protein ASE40_20625 [Flavobacterium sp. Root935]|uniref:hypothetical protein n=1 Tax=Flavobacterium sp. Root935 TaxID=1736610 RepID=UPI00070FC5E0|nr:hypothetical protein [Flavobacterium sp. Root935]KRD58719.1 hypothetical protein ASE40_20625 [Flavobacterium sp. Root935]
MENKNSKSGNAKNTEICKDCEALVGKKRYTPPHRNLKKKEIREVNSIFGNVDEHYYECNSCSTTWLHETGSYGEGWILN